MAPRIGFRHVLKAAGSLLNFPLSVNRFDTQRKRFAIVPPAQASIKRAQPPCLWSPSPPLSVVGSRVLGRFVEFYTLRPVLHGCPFGEKR